MSCFIVNWCFKNELKIICISHYLSAPAFSWDAMLDMTKVELELSSDGDTFLFFEKDIKSGVPYSSKKYKKSTISIWNLMTQNKNQNVLYSCT